MKAIVMDRFGGAEVLQLKEVAVPTPGAGQMQVKVHATGLNPADFKIRMGHLNEIFPVQFPRILGGDVAGVVTAVGAGVDALWVGREVYFSLPLDKDGGYAEYCVVDADLVASKPRGLSFEEAASLPVAALTAVQSLRDFSGLKAGQKVLIHAGAGGVGSIAIQYAKVLGAEVFTTASAANADFVRSLGADHVIDYRAEDFVAVAKAHGGMDVVLDTLGGETLSRSIEATREGGAVPCIVNPPDGATVAAAKARRVKTDFFLLHSSAADLALIAGLVERGQLRPIVSQVLPLEAVAEGHRQLESGRTRGKLVLRLRDGARHSL